jgi:predicted PurR-regulated permease PerM
VEFLRAKREKRYALIINDPKPVERVDDIWASAAQMAVIGIFVLLLGAVLYFCRPLLLPIMAALVVSTTLAPVVKWAARRGLSPWVMAIFLVVGLLAAAGIAVTAPVAEWIGRAPEIGASIKEKLYVLAQPLGSLRELQEALLPSAGNAVAVEPSQLSVVTPVLAFVTPAVAQLVLFVVSLIFLLAGQMEFRRYLASLFPRATWRPIWRS